MDPNRHDPMNPVHDEDDILLDSAIDAARADLPAADQIRASGERSWALVSEALEAERPLVTDADYEALIPAYLAGTLSSAKTMLIADRISANAAFRKTVEAARRGAPLESARPAARVLPIRRVPVWAATAAAAVVLAAGGWLFGRDFLMPQRVLAHVDTIDGELYRVGKDGEALADGAEIRPRERLLASRDGGAVIELNDGTIIELAPRSEISLATRWNGRAIRLDRGNIIVQAAPQRDGRLFVATDECVVSVTGTIFSVRHGTKGSRVAVLEGEVRVDQAGQRTVLSPGQQVTTNPSLSPIPMHEEVAWSRDHERWMKILEELRALGEEIDATVARPEPRTASALLDAVPADTVVFMSLPNLSETLDQSYSLFRERVAESASLSEWWDENFEDPEDIARLDALVERLGSAGDALGDEIVISLGVDGAGELGLPIVLAEVRDADAFREAVEASIAEIGDELEGEEMPIRWIDDPADALAVALADLAEAPVLTIDPDVVDGAGAPDGSDASSPGLDVIEDAVDHSVGDDALNLWIADGRLAASPSLEALAGLADGATGIEGDFRSRIIEAYDDGVDWVFAVDLDPLEAMRSAFAETDAPDLIGLSQARHLIVTEVTRDGRSQTEAGLTYRESRVGAAAWLAEPAALGGLDFISPDAHAAAAAIMERPEQIVESLFGLIGAADPEAALEPEIVLSQELLSDVAASLGGQVAIALDGPVLPRPSWRAAIEVYDPDALQSALARIVDEINARALEHDLGTDQPPLTLVASPIGERAGWSITFDAAVDALEFRPAVHYTYADGYLVAASSPALVDAAIRQRESGVNLGTSSAFVNAFPTGGEIDFSAVAWQNVGGLVEEAARFAEERGEAAVNAPFKLAQSLGPSLFYAWVEPDAVRFAGAADKNPLGFGMLFGLGGLTRMPDMIDGMDHGFEGLPDAFDQSLDGEARMDPAWEHATAGLIDRISGKDAGDAVGGGASR